MAQQKAVGESRPGFPRVQPYQLVSAAARFFKCLIRTIPALERGEALALV